MKTHFHEFGVIFRPKLPIFQRLNCLRLGCEKFTGGILEVAKAKFRGIAKAMAKNFNAGNIQKAKVKIRKLIRKQYKLNPI